MDQALQAEQVPVRPRLPGGGEQPLCAHARSKSAWPPKQHEKEEKFEISGPQQQPAAADWGRPPAETVQPGSR